MPISSALKGWDSSGAYEWGKEFLLIVASRIYKPSKRSVDIAMCHTQNQRKSKILSYKKIKQGGGHLINYRMPISSALKGWDSIGAHKYMKKFLLMVASRIYNPSKRNMDIVMLSDQNHTGPIISPLQVGATM